MRKKKSVSKKEILDLEIESARVQIRQNHLVEILEMVKELQQRRRSCFEKNQERRESEDLRLLYGRDKGA